MQLLGFLFPEQALVRDCQCPAQVLAQENPSPVQVRALGFRFPEPALVQANPYPALALEQGCRYQVLVQAQGFPFPVRALVQVNPLAGFAMGHRFHRRRSRSALRPECPKESN